MSELQQIGSPMPGRYGAAGVAQLSMQRVPAMTILNLQGDADNTALAQQARALWGIADLPRTHRSVTASGHTVLWIGPRSWLVFGPAPADAASTAADFPRMRDLVNRAGGALFDLSAARVGWTLRGPRARDVLSSGCPLDLDDSAFAPGSCAQSLFGHVAALLHRDSDEAFTLYVARSFSDDVWNTVCSTAAQYGYEVLAPAA